MGAQQRAKGARFERDIAKRLFAELGITFARNLAQYQAADHGDLTPDNDAFPFLLECKARSTGADCQAAWMAQAAKAAAATGQHAAVVYKIGTQPIRVRIGIDAIVEAHGGTAVTHDTADLSIPAFAYVARELMARRAEKARWSA